MATITVRGLDDLLHARLKLRAAQNGRSMEEEARMILRQTLEPKTTQAARLGERIRALNEDSGYWDLDADDIRDRWQREDKRIRDLLDAFEEIGEDMGDEERPS